MLEIINAVCEMISTKHKRLITTFYHGDLMVPYKGSRLVLELKRTKKGRHERIGTITFYETCLTVSGGMGIVRRTIEYADPTMVQRLTDTLRLIT